MAEYEPGPNPGRNWIKCRWVLEDLLFHFFLSRPLSEPGLPSNDPTRLQPYCQLDAAGADLGQGVTNISQAAVAAFHSLKERSRNSR